MLKNYIKIAIRNLLRHKVHSIVNISGLVIGLTCGILVFIYVLYELSYDQFHDKAKNIYRLGREMVTSESVIREPLSSAPSGIALAHDFPEISGVVRFGNLGKIIVRYEDKKFYEEHIYYVDPSVFDIFNFPMISGDPQTALVKPYSVVITEETATKYFGDENPLGKTLRFNNQHDYLVSGVIKNVPDNSHFDFNMLCSIETLYAQKHPNLDNWLSFDYLTYVLVKDNIDYKELEQKFPEFIDKYIGDEFKTRGKSIKFFLHPLTKIQLYSHLEGYSPGRITQVYFVAIFALCIILIACINFMNLCIARSTNRAREVGIRKVIGAHRSKLIYQFIGEALILSLISLFFALLLVELILPAFSTIIRQKLTLSFSEMPGLIPSFLGLAIFMGIVSGSYPAFYLSRFHPVQVLKGNLTMSVRKIRLRSILVVFQFFTSTVFIIQTFIFGIQINNLRHKDIGFNKKNLVVLPIVDEEVKQSYKLLKEELKNCSDVVNVAATSTLPGWYIPRNLKIPQGYAAEQMQPMDDINVDQNFFPTLQVEMAAGRNFSEEFSTDKSDAIIINETAAKKYGWDNPIGKTIQYSSGADKFATGTVYGVVKDFHLATLYRVIEPLYVSNNPDNLNYLLIRIRPENIQQTIAFIKGKWNEMYPNYPFDYSFLEHSYDYYFRVLEKVLKILSYFTFLAIFIACLGIFALATYNAEYKIKEIGIRKIMGATTFGIIVKLNKEIIKLVFIAIILAWLFMQIRFVDPHMFLPYFADIKFTIYLKSALLVVLIALLTISYQSIKTAMANPVDSIRYE
jgi:putative ABC transport system permease protein